MAFTGAWLMLAAAASAVSARPHIDHVIVGVPDLDRGIAEMERLTGVRAVPGGVHPGNGTRNALMSLGPETYLEIFAPNPAEPPSADTKMLRKLRKPTVVGWGVSAADLQGLRDRAAAGGEALSAVEPGSRRTPAGEVLKWHSFGYARFDDPNAPFFIVWDRKSVHPSRSSPRGCVLRSLSIADPHPARLRRVIAPLALDVQVRPSSRAGMRLALKCPRGDVAVE